MADRKDYLSECNDHNVPVRDFQASFCARCFQPECSRSLHGKMKFDQRVATWEDRLFDQVPRMKENDPRYLPIAGAEFRTLGVPSVTSVAITGGSEWHDPRNLPSPSEALTVPEEKKPTASSLVFDKIEPKSDELESTPSPIGVRKLPRHLLLMNAPAQPLMLPGSLEPKPPVDRWAGPVPTEDVLPSEPIVKKGARIKFGGSGGVE